MLQNFNPQQQYQQMSDYIRSRWQALITGNLNKLTSPVLTAVQNYLNNNIGQWTNYLCQTLNNNPGGMNEQTINQIIFGWFNEAVRMCNSSLGYFPQVPQVPQFPNAGANFGINPGFGGMQPNGMGMGMSTPGMGYGYGSPAMPPMGANSLLAESNQMYAGQTQTPQKVSIPAPITPMSNIPTQTNTTPVKKEVEAIEKTAAKEFNVANSYKVPNNDGVKSTVNIKLPVAGKGWIETWTIGQGTKTAKKLFIELDKFTDNVKEVLDKLKKKYKNCEIIVIKYRSFDVIKADLKELQDAFIEIKTLLRDEDKNYEVLTQELLDLLNNKKIGVMRVVESIVLNEYNRVIKDFELDTPPVKTLEELLQYDQESVCYVKSALSLLLETTIYDPASSDMTSYLNDYEVEEDKTYKELRKAKDRFAKWASQHAVVVSHSKIMRYTEIFDAASDVANLIASGDFEIGFVDDGASLGSDFEYFLYDDIGIESSVEDLIIHNGSSTYETSLTRMNVNDGVKYTRQVTLRNK